MFKQQKEQITIADLSIPLAFFQQQEPTYALPEGAIGVEYTPNVEHVVLYEGRMVGAALPWAEGDGYLSKVEQYRSAWEAKQLADTPAPMPPKKYPQWEALKSSLRDSDLFVKAYQASTNAPGAWALLLATLDSNSLPDDAGRLRDFAFAIAQIRLALGVSDFTTEQLTRFNQMLIDCDFELTIA